MKNLKNLKNLNLQELTIEEQTNTNGGFFGITAAIAISAVVVSAVGVVASFAGVAASIATIKSDLFIAGANIGAAAYRNR